jgi:hypothetical protein
MDPNMDLLMIRDFTATFAAENAKQIPEVFVPKGDETGKD